jgi:membrane-bound lytic murein transglycosylase B
MRSPTRGGAAGRLRVGVATVVAAGVLAGTVPRALAVPAVTASTRSASPAGSAISVRPVAAGGRTAADEASSARARVEAQLDRYQDASARVDEAERALGAAFAAGADADVDEEAARARRRRAETARAVQVRAVYAAGGGSALTASLVGAASPDDALWRASTVDRVLAGMARDAHDRVLSATARARLARNRAEEADAAVEAQARALQQLQDRAQVAAGTLAEAERTLAALDEKARRTRAAREAARQIAVARAAAANARRSALGPVTALGIPADYERDYRAAASTCPGLTWTLLAAVGQVETGHGRDHRTSSAGAIGPMQFMPATFASFAVDGDHDGVLDARDPEDAIFTAAHYLCVSAVEAGGLGSAAGVRAALLAYNHAEWYVDLVLAAQAAITARAAAPPG